MDSNFQFLVARLSTVMGDGAAAARSERIRHTDRFIPTTGNSRDQNSFDPTRVLKSGTTLVRQWRGHPHTVLVREDGFEYDG
jgi:hypothetical protein